MADYDDNELIMTLGKVIIAAAWADGEITDDELNSLKDLIFHLPNVSARQWEVLDLYMDSPVSEAERTRLMAELVDLTRSDDQRALAIQTLNNMVAADGEVTDEEKAVVAELEQALNSANTGAWGSFSRLLIGRRSGSVAEGPNREMYFDDYINNRVYFRVKQQLTAEGVDPGLNDAELRQLSLAGGLMAKVARVEPDITGGEREAMGFALQSKYNLTTEQAAFVTEIALSPDIGDLDFYRLTRSFSDATTLDQRCAFTETLFTMAAADGFATFNEIEEIRLIAQGLKLTHQEFIAAKLTLPRDKRQD